MKLNFKSVFKDGRRKAAMSACLLAAVITGLEDKSATPALAQGEQPTDDALVQEETLKSRQRLEFMNKAAGRYDIRIGTPEGTRSDLLHEPLLRWMNPQSTARDGIMVAWSRGGRPDVVAQFAIYANGNLIHEFSSTCDDRLIMQRNGQVQWVPAGTALVFQDFENVPPPAKTELLRMTQMRKLAEKFEVMDDHGWEETVRQQLRLMSKASHRYQDASQKVIDGSVFTFVLATDPEAVVFIEAYESSTGPRWRYAFSPITVYALQASLDGQVVWDKPERRPPNGPEEHHISTRYQTETDDPPLKPLLPSDRAGQ